MLKLLHEGHFGITRTTDRAREILFWPGMAKDIEKMIARCSVCERYRYANIKEPMICHEIPDFPFQKLGTDIMEFKGRAYLVVADYLTKWLEIVPLKGKQSSDVINALKNIFSVFGIPDIIVSDNMPFASYECKKFAVEFDFKFQTSSPGYAQSNGLAERFFQTAKNILKKSDDISVALMEYRNTPIPGLNRSPAQLLFFRRLKTKLPVVEKQMSDHEQFKLHLQNKNRKSKDYYDAHARARPDFKEGDRVVHRRGKEWHPATVVSKHSSPRSYIIESESNVLRRNRVDLRRSRRGEINRDYCNRDSSEEKKDQVQSNESQLENDGDIVENRQVEDPMNNNVDEEYNNSRPVRNSRLPKKYSDYVMY
ncbi:uncharacterized protein K02A2.6-like [Nilaparvata lugens]|uniref:uncharacterized protein K02A2.6-like n=1 Tax=Nilaparvata lugens TaxID=108931 RepID=UPI00193DEF46|nr:uncharacterized protein K02A2.6-like [Nilaparvata lugens]